MPETLAPTENLGAFPTGQYFSENMQRGQFGLAALLSNLSIGDDSSISGLANVQVFTDGVISNQNAIYAQDSNGIFYSRLANSQTWAQDYSPGGTNTGAGMVQGSDDHLYYVGDRYLGRVQFGTPYTTGTISVTNGSTSVTGSGGAVFVNDPTTGDINRRIKILGVWYTIAAVPSGTTLTLATPYAGTTASGLSFAIYRQWVDQYKDFGHTLASKNYAWATPFNYEGDLIIPRGPNVCALHSDGSFSDENSPVFNIPSAYRIRCAAGGNNGILFGAEMDFGSRSYLILWDNFSDRSIAPWLPLKSPVQALKPYGAGWIVVTKREILFTNGYSIQILSKGIDPRLGQDSFNCTPYGIEVIDDRLIIANQIGGYTRKRSGIYIFSITNGDYQYLAPLGTHTYNVTPYAVFLDSAQGLNLSVETVKPAKKSLTLIQESAPSRAYVVSNPLFADADKKYATGVKIDMAVPEGQETITAEITLKLAPLNRRMFGIQKAKSDGTQTNQITVDGTNLSDAQAGDEIIIMEGVNAGSMRNISAISGQGTSSEVWTLDEALGSNIEQNAYISITPFRKVAKKSVTSAAQLRDMYFNVMNHYKGKRFMAKAELSNLNGSIEILSVTPVAEPQDIHT